MSTELSVFKKPADLMAYLQKGKGAVAMALPAHLKPDRMLRLALTCFSTTPKLRECSGQSILASIVVASQLGLEPGVAGQGYLIPYKQTCTFVPGWQGLVGLLNNSGRATAWTGAVFEGDVWDFQLGSAPRCAHIPGPNFGDPEKITWVYACGKVNGSEQPVVEAWPVSRVWKHRDRFNKVGRQHYSFTHPEMYARKVVLLQVLKYMPRSIELNNAMTAANAAESGNSSKVEDGVVVEVESETTTTVSNPPRFQAPAGGDQTHEPQKATPAQAMANLCKSAGFPEATLLQYLISQGAVDENAQTLEDVSEVAFEQLKAHWVEILPTLKASMDKSAPEQAEPASTSAVAADADEIDVIPTEHGPLVQFVRGKCEVLDLDEKQVVKFVAKQKKCGAACKTLTDMNPTGLQWIAANIVARKDEIAAE